MGRITTLNQLKNEYLTIPENDLLQMDKQIKKEVASCCTNPNYNIEQKKKIISEFILQISKDNFVAISEKELKTRSEFLAEVYLDNKEEMDIGEKLQTPVALLISAMIIISAPGDNDMYNLAIYAIAAVVWIILTLLINIKASSISYRILDCFNYSCGSMSLAGIIMYYAFSFIVCRVAGIIAFIIVISAQFFLTYQRYRSLYKM